MKNVPIDKSKMRTPVNKLHPTIALVGCGAIAEKFYLPVLKKDAAVMEHLILVDNNINRAKKMSEQFHVESCVSDYREVIHAVDGVIIAVPHHLHFSTAKAFLSTKVHVLCEKPVAETAAEVKELARLAEENGVTISANNTRRLVPNCIEVKKLIDEGEIGDLRVITYLEGGEFDWPTASGFYFNSDLSHKGVLLDVGAHAFDVICQWVGGRPRLISSENDSFGGREAVASVTLEYKKCRCIVRLSWLGKLPNSFRIVGDKGTIEGPIYDWRSFTITSSSGRKQKVRTDTGTHSPFFHERPVTNFIDVLRKKDTPLIPASAVIESIELIEEAYKSARRFSMPWYEAQETQDAD